MKTELEFGKKAKNENFEGLKEGKKMKKDNEDVKKVKNESN